MVREDTELGGPVGFHGLVAVEVVGEEVEEDGDVGAECFGELQLKAADFGNEDLFGAGREGQFDQGHADISADAGGEVGVLEDFAEEGGGGGFAFGAGDRDDRGAGEPGGDFDFGDDANAGRAALSRGGMVGGTPGLGTMRSAASIPV